MQEILSNAGLTATNNIITSNTSQFNRDTDLLYNVFVETLASGISICDICLLTL